MMNKRGRPSISEHERKNHLVLTIDQRIINAIKDRAESTGKSVSSIVNEILKKEVLC